MSKTSSLLFLEFILDTLGPGFLGTSITATKRQGPRLQHKHISELREEEAQARDCKRLQEVET